MSACVRSRAASQRATAASLMPAQNLVVQRKCACGGAAGFSGACAKCDSERLQRAPLQAKLRINAPGDIYEQEAERVANEVMRLTEPDDLTGEAHSPGMLERFPGASGGATSPRIPVVQRQEAAGGEAPGERAQVAAESETAEQESPCPSWFNDPQSISKRAAEHYVQNDMTPPSQATVERTECEPPRANGNYGCYVHFSDGLVIRVIVRKQDIVVGTAPINTWTPPPATPLCFYDYRCPEGQLVLTKRECKSAAPAGPTQVAQRRSAPGETRAMAAPPLVHEVLASAGQMLDGATREFFSARFGHDFAKVRVHADTKAAQSARSINALAYTVGHDVVFGSGQYAPGTRAGRQLLAHELAHVLQQSGGILPAAPAQHPHGAGAPTASAARSLRAGDPSIVQRQPEREPEPLSVRDFPILLEKLELDVGQNLRDYGHHLYQAAVLHGDKPEVLKGALARYALGLNVLKTAYRFAGLKPENADKLALGTGILFKGLTLVKEGKLALDFQFDIGRGIKLETNIDLGLNPKNLTGVKQATVNVGFVRRF